MIWKVLKGDIFSAIENFYKFGNTSLVTLIPKVDNPKYLRNIDQFYWLGAQIKL